MTPYSSGNQNRETTRRSFIKAGALSVCAFSPYSSATGPGKAAGEMPPLDYGLSFICHSAVVNSVRFWVESRTRIIDDRTGTWTDFYQCGSCKSENTFAERDLFMKENYDFLPVFGGEDVLVFRRPASLSERYRTIKKAVEMWGEPEMKLQEGGRVMELTEWNAIASATADAIPLVAQTEVANTETRLRAIMEFPVKTMNIDPEKKRYQVDTGTIALPDLTIHANPLIDALRLAFVAFNTADFADFIIEQPIAITGDNGSNCQTYHYSNPVSMPSKNRIFAVYRG